MSKNFVTGVFLLVLILTMLWVMEPEKENINEELIFFQKSNEIATDWIKNNLTDNYYNNDFELILKEKEEIIKNSIYRFSFILQFKSNEYKDQDYYDIEVIVDNKEVLAATKNGVLVQIKRNN